MERGQIDVAADRLRVVAERGFVEQRDQARHSVAALEADDGPDVGVGEDRVEVPGAVLVATGHVAVPVIDVGAQLDPETPGFAAGDAPKELAPVLPAARRRDDADRVALAEAGRLAGRVVTAVHRDLIRGSSSPGSIQGG